MKLTDQATNLLHDFKGSNYSFGFDQLDQVGAYAAEFGRTALVIANSGEWLKPIVDQVLQSLQRRHIALAGERIVPDAGPNAPREDVYRIESYILHFQPDCIIVIGGGSSIDAAKAANALAGLGQYSPEIDSYFGTGRVTAALKESGGKLRPLIAVQTAASSGAHLTKYANITDPLAGQKKLIVDEALIPARAVFDYGVTVTAPLGLAIDGALDGMAHCLEVFYGAGGERYEQIRAIALTGLQLVVDYAGRLVSDRHNREACAALGLATDLGGYAIMIGGTSGAHLTSFSLVDVTSHGRACGIMNPYYTVFFAPAIEPQLREVGAIFRRAGYIRESLADRHGRQLGLAVARSMAAFSQSIGAPTKLADLPGFTDGHIARALAAAKDPQLAMKLQNMPVPLRAESVDQYLKPILEAARSGDFDLIKNID